MTDSKTSDKEQKWPPSFCVELTERKDAVMRCYELMERLTDEYGGRGRIRKVSENRLSVELEYDIPPRDRVI